MLALLAAGVGLAVAGPLAGGASAAKAPRTARHHAGARSVASTAAWPANDLVGKQQRLHMARVRERLLTPLQRAVADGRSARVTWSVLAAVETVGLHRHQSLRKAGFWLRRHGAPRSGERPSSYYPALVRYYQSPVIASRALAVAAYGWALGRPTADGLAPVASQDLAAEILRDPHVTLTALARRDVASGRMDPRVLLTIRYLEGAFGSIKVSCLISGHSLLTAAGNVSAHISGRAVDISAVGGVPIVGHQGYGTITERAVRLLLALPPAYRARQIVSLMDLDGPTGRLGSFALPDHSDHIHVGF